MKKFIALTMALILVISTMVAVTSVSAAAQPSQNDQTESNVLFSWADIKAANENGTLASMIKCYGTWTYNTTHDYMELSRPSGFCNLTFTTPTDKVDMTQKNWIAGKSVEFELTVLTNVTNNLTLNMHAYHDRDPEFENQANPGDMSYGSAIWWWQKNSALNSVNAFPIPGTTHTVAEEVLPLAQGTTQRFRITQTEDALYYYYLNPETKAWALIDEAYDVEDLGDNRGGLWFMTRGGGDVWALTDLVIYKNSDSEFYGVQETALYDTNGDTTPDAFDVRFISQVDASAVTNYTEIGFEVSATFGTNGVVAPKRYETTCYNTLLASDRAGNIERVTAPEGKYFCALAIEEIPTSAGTVTFTIKPYVIENGIYVYGAAYDVIYNAATATFVSAAISG